MSAITVDNRAKNVEQLKKSGPIEHLTPEQEKKTYTAVVQLGPCVRWRGFKSGSWKRNTEGDNPVAKTRAYVAVPNVNETGPITGKTLNGLISAHNKWLENNKGNRLPMGGVARQIALISFEETDDAPVDVPIPRLTPDVVERIAAGVAGRLLKELLGSDSK